MSAFATVHLAIAFTSSATIPREPCAPLALRSGVLIVKVIECDELQPVNGEELMKQSVVGPPNMFAALVLERKSLEVRTHEHRKAGTAPVWNVAFAVEVRDPERDVLIVAISAVRDKPTPAQFVGRARVNALVLAARAALDNVDSVVWDVWLPLLDRFADTQSSTTRGRIHLLLTYNAVGGASPLPRLSTEVEALALAKRTIAARGRPSLQPLGAYVGGRVLLASSVQTYKYGCGSQKRRRLSLVDGSGSMPPSLVFEEMRCLYQMYINI